MMYPMHSSLLLVVVVGLLLLASYDGLIVVAPDYTITMTYVYPVVTSTNATIAELKSNHFLRHHKHACLTDTSRAGHSVNRIHEIRDNGPFRGLRGTTIWINEWMQVGHSPFDSVLIQVLQSTTVDRIILQRAACQAHLCDGVGNFRSFYVAYYAAAIESGINPGIPVYMRQNQRDTAVKAHYVSTQSVGYTTNDLIHKKKAPDTINLDENSCFDEVILRGPLHHGNFYGSKSSLAVQTFKRTAYHAASILAINNNQPLSTTFRAEVSAQHPYVILFSYRGRTHRHIENYPVLIEQLQTAFPVTNHYSLRLMNNGNSSLTAEMQIKAVAEAHVVITNHGAFEGNLVYMRNGSLLIELCGNYENDDFKLFQNYSREFGVFYSRLQAETLKDHNQVTYNMSAGEINEMVGVVRTYFEKKPFLAMTA